MRPRATRRAEWLMAGCWQWDIPLRKIGFVTGGLIDRVGCRLGLHRLPRRIRIDVHHVMRIDEIDSHEPRLTLRLQFACLRSYPRHCGLGGKVVKGVSPEGAVNQVADSQEIRETIRFDNLTILEQ